VVAADGRQLRFRAAIIATGSRPALPPIPRLREAEFITNETVFDPQATHSSRSPVHSVPPAAEAENSPSSAVLTSKSGDGPVGDVVEVVVDVD